MLGPGLRGCPHRNPSVHVSSAFLPSPPCDRMLAQVLWTQLHGVVCPWHHQLISIPGYPSSFWTTQLWPLPCDVPGTPPPTCTPQGLPVPGPHSERVVSDLPGWMASGTWRFPTICFHTDQGGQHLLGDVPEEGRGAPQQSVEAWNQPGCLSGALSAYTLSRVHGLKDRMKLWQ